MNDGQDLVKRLKSIGFFMEQKLIAAVIEFEQLCAHIVWLYNRHVSGWLSAVYCDYLFVEVLKAVYEWLNLAWTSGFPIIDHELEIGANFGELPESLETDVQKAIQMAMFVFGPKFLDHEWALKSGLNDWNLVKLGCWSNGSWTILRAWSFCVLV